MIGAVAQDIIARVVSHTHSSTPPKKKNKKQLTPQKPGSDLESVVYPASINNVQDYANSEHQGTLALTQLIQAYLAACPTAKIALLGYSQGAEVVGDVLCGTSSDISPKTAPLATQYGNAVVAAISMGSPAHVANQPYNKGTSTRNGVSETPSPSPEQLELTVPRRSGSAGTRRRASRTRQGSSSTAIPTTTTATARRSRWIRPSRCTAAT